MKKDTKLGKAFAFDKETIAKLTNAQMSALAGGNGAAQNEVIATESCAFASVNTCNTKTDVA